MIPSTECKSFEEQSKWLTPTTVKKTHRGFDMNTGEYIMHRENVGESKTSQQICVFAVDNAMAIQITL